MTIETVTEQYIGFYLEIIHKAIISKIQRYVQIYGKQCVGSRHFQDRGFIYLILSHLSTLCFQTSCLLLFLILYINIDCSPE